MIGCQTVSEMCERCTPTRKCGWDCWYNDDEKTKKIIDQIEYYNGQSKLDS